MKRLGASITGLWVSAVLAAAPAFGAPASITRSCCHVPAGTVVEVELVNPVSTKVQKSGDTFALRLAAPLIVNGEVVLRAGAPGVGDVVESEKPGMGGKAAKLVLAARYLDQRHGRVALQGLQLSAAGRDNSSAANVVGLTGIAFAPLGFIGLAVTGGDVVFPAGTSATAKIADNIVLPPRGRASRYALAAAARSAAPEAADDAITGSVEVPPPPAGEGQVIFFRKKSLLGVGQWFNVRENGKALGKLSNGAYFVQITDPGLHTYTATMEPELKDHLTLQVDPGETYFVEGTFTKGLVVGAADISPSDRPTFDEASKNLKPAATPGDDKAADQPAETPVEATAAQAGTASVAGP